MKISSPFLIRTTHILKQKFKHAIIPTSTILQLFHQVHQVQSISGSYHIIG